MESVFNLGDVVQLKSGGPRMTLLERKDDKEGVAIYQTVWFAKKESRTATFPHHVLKPSPST
jgi:uncharacterized protein YodC (DUF2158 family)